MPGIAAQVDPGLVDVNSVLSYQSAEGAGTGIVLTSNGEILTNNHVINGATRLSITDIGNGQSYDATVVGYDSTRDIAVLQLQGASGLKVAKIADSSKVAVGDPVVAIGNAGGRGGTPSAAGGSVTALNQQIMASDDLDGTSEQLSGLIQVNADVQPGDSGGALVDSSGRVIGVDTAASQSFSIQAQGNAGFAIPINEALSIARQIVAGRASVTVHIGATAFLGVLSTAAGQNGFGGTGTGTGTGAVISQVVDGGAAASAGLVPGDVITSVDGRTVDSPTTLSALLVARHPGDKVRVAYTDNNGQSQLVTVQLGTGPPA